jgi:membrane protein DedA with SNARE-associated domain
MKKILRTFLIIILLLILVQVIFGASAAFLPGDVIATLTGMISSMGGAGLVGFLLGVLCLYIVLKKQKNK